MSFTYPDSLNLGDTDKRKLDKAFNSIKEAILNRNAYFLFGAGMSAEADFPTGGELTNELLKSFLDPSGDSPPSDDILSNLVGKYPFEALVETYEKDQPRQRKDLTKILKTIFEKDVEIPKAHRDFASLCSIGARPNFRFIFTTNFDDLLDKSLGGQGEPVTGDQELYKIVANAYSQGKTPIIYLHGKLTGDYDYTITESDIFRTRTKPRMNLFRATLDEADAFVFVGYSLSDPDTKLVFMNFREELDELRRNYRNIYVVDSIQDSHSQASSSYQVGVELWASRGVTLIPIGAGPFFARLKLMLEDDQQRDTIEKLKKAYNISDEDLLEQKIEKMKELFQFTKREDAITFLLDAKKV